MQSLQAVSLLWSVGLEHLSPVVILRFKRLRKNPCHAAQHVGGCDDDNQHDEQVEREEVDCYVVFICLMFYYKVPPFV